MISSQLRVEKSAAFDNDLLWIRISGRGQQEKLVQGSTSPKGQIFPKEIVRENGYQCP